MNPPQHWEDITLLHVVEQDLRRKQDWREITRTYLELPPCTCCETDEQIPNDPLGSHVQPGHVLPRVDRAKCRHGSQAAGISGSVRDARDGEARGVTRTLVFAVNAGLSLPTRRFSDVVVAAEEFLRSRVKATTGSGDDADLAGRQRVLAAFCDGTSIIYYKASSGIDVS